MEVLDRPVSQLNLKLYDKNIENLERLIVPICPDLFFSPQLVLALSLTAIAKQLTVVFGE